MTHHLHDRWYRLNVQLNPNSLSVERRAHTSQHKKIIQRKRRREKKTHNLMKLQLIQMRSSQIACIEYENGILCKIVEHLNTDGWIVERNWKLFSNINVDMNI